MARKSREQKFIHEFEAPYKFRSIETGEIETRQKRIGIRPHTQRNKFPNLVLVCECNNNSWEKLYYFDKKQNALFSTYNLRYIQPGSETSCFILHYLQDYFTFQAAEEKIAAIAAANPTAKCEVIHCTLATDYDDSQPEAAEMPATAEITQATDNDNALASQPASVASSQSETNDDAKSLLDADYFKGKSINEIKRAFSPASLKQLKGFALCYTIPYFNRMNKKQLIDAIASKISLILEERKGYITAENVTGDNGYAQQDDIIITATKPRTIPEPVRVKFIPGTVYAGNDSGNHFPVKITARNADFVTTDFIGAYIKDAKIQTIAGVEHAVFPMQYRNIEIWADKPELPEPVQSKTNAQHEITQPDNLYDDGSFSDAPGDNSCPDMDIPECHTPDSITPDNPGFTVVPHDRMHITRPDYTVYPDAIHDDIPCVNVPACVTQTLSSDAVNAITAAKCRWASELISLLLFLWKIIIPLMFMRKFDARRDNTTPFIFSVGYKYPAYFHDKKQLLTVYERTTDKFGFSWLSVSDEDNISYRVRVKLRDDRYTELLDFKELERTCYAFDGLKPVKESNRVKYIKFQIGKSYTAVDDSYGHHERHITVLDRLVAVRNNFKDKIVYLKVRMSDSKLPNEAVDAWISVWVDRQIHAEHYASTPYLNFRADQPDAVQEIPAEINNITPVKDWDKIIADNTNSIINFDYDDFKHVKHAGKIHDRINSHNYALVDACESLDDIRMLLAGVSKPTLIGIMQLTADYFGTCGDYHEKEMDNIPHMIDSLIERIDYCRKDKAYWTQLKQEKSQTEQAQPKTRKPNPAPASDIEHKLIDTTNLHFQERRDALDHNAAVISSCMFHEAIVSMLLKISPAAIFQLGMHMGLFIAKPKGKKIVIAEAFAKRLIEHRELHAKKAASVHTHNAQHTSINTAGIPHNVKFFETKHGQFAFIFTDELVFTD